MSTLRQSSTQAYLDLGQKHFSIRRCVSCGMMYTPGIPGDEELHRRSCKPKQPVLKLQGVPPDKTACMLSLPAGQQLRMVCCASTDPAPITKKVRQVCSALEVQLGLSTAALMPPARMVKVYVCLSTSHEVLGLVAAELLPAHTTVTPLRQPAGQAASGAAADGGAGYSSAVGGGTWPGAKSAHHRQHRAEFSSTSASSQRIIHQPTALAEVHERASPNTTPHAPAACSQQPSVHGANASTSVQALQPTLAAHAAANREPGQPVMSQLAQVGDMGHRVGSAGLSSSGIKRQGSEPAALFSKRRSCPAPAQAAGQVRSVAMQETGEDAVASAPCCSRQQPGQSEGQGQDQGEQHYSAVCGVRLVWVASSYRHKGVARKMLDVVRSHVLPGYMVPRQKVAYNLLQLALGQEEGTGFAASYMRPARVLMYSG